MSIVQEPEGLHELWGQAKASPEYDKKKWLAFQKRLSKQETRPMPDWSPEKEDEDNPRHMMHEMVEAFGQIERDKADRQEARYAPPPKLHPGFQVYCLAYEAAWRETIRNHVCEIPHATAAATFQQLDRLVAIEIHRIALLATENFAPPELEKEETEQ